MSGYWEFALLQGSDSNASAWGAVADLSSARSRRLSFRLDEGSSMSFVVDGYDPEALYVDELTTDVIAYRDGSPLFRGRIVQTQDQLDADTHTVSVTVADYKTMLNRRQLFPGDAELTAYSTTLGNPAVEQEAIGWALINRVQSRASGNWGITRGIGQTTGVARNRTYDPGAKIFDAIQSLAHSSPNGFEWDIDPALVYRVYYPQRGADIETLCELGGMMTRVSRSVASADYANVVLLQGGSAPNSGGTEVPTTPVSATGTEVTAGTAVEGRFELFINNSDLTLQSSVNERAPYELAQAQQVMASYSVVLNSEIWNGPDDLWLGDTARVVIESGRLNVDTVLRVIAIDIDVDDNGVETATATLGKLTPAQRYMETGATVARRLDTLERR